jgi:hypothetical protein
MAIPTTIAVPLGWSVCRAAPNPSRAAAHRGDASFSRKSCSTWSSPPKSQNLRVRTTSFRWRAILPAILPNVRPHVPTFAGALAYHSSSAHQVRAGPTGVVGGSP